MHGCLMTLMTPVQEMGQDLGRLAVFGRSVVAKQNVHSQTLHNLKTPSSNTSSNSKPQPGCRNPLNQSC